jgi:hypothetical protein
MRLVITMSRTLMGPSQSLNEDWISLVSPIYILDHSSSYQETPYAQTLGSDL